MYKHWSHETLTDTDTNTITTDWSNFMYLCGDNRSLCECEERKKSNVSEKSKLWKYENRCFMSFTVVNCLFSLSMNPQTVSFYQLLSLKMTENSDTYFTFHFKMMSLNVLICPTNNPEDIHFTLILRESNNLNRW